MLSATVGLSLKGIWARFAYGEGASVETVMLYRAALALPVLLGAAVWLRRRRRRSTRAPETERQLAHTAAVGALFAFGMYCDFRAIAELGAGLSRVILFGFPLLLVAAESTARRQLPTRRRLIGFALAWGGLAALVWPAAGGGVRASAPALQWGLYSMATYAAYLWISGRISRRIGSVPFSIVSNLATCVTVIGVVACADAGALQAPRAAVGWVAVLVVASTVGPYFLLNEGVRRLGSARAGLLAMLGPPITLTCGWLLLGEPLGPRQLLGAAATLLGVAVTQSHPEPMAQQLTNHRDPARV